MALPNAKRVQHQTSLAPIDLRRSRPGDRDIADPGRPPVERAALLRSFVATPEELAALREKTSPGANHGVLDAWASADFASLVTTLAEHPDIHAASSLATNLARHRLGVLEEAEARVEAALKTAENEWIDAVVEAHHRDARSFDAPRTARVARSARVAGRLAPDDKKRLDAQMRAGLDDQLDALLSELEGKHGLPAIAPQALRGVEPPKFDLAKRLKKLVGCRAAFDQRPRAARVSCMLQSAELPDAQKRTLRAATRSLGLDPQSVSFETDWHVTFATKVSLKALASGLSPDPNPCPVSPVGYLHLERLSYVPAGVEHGELVYSLPLAPGEQVAIVHKEWGSTEEEFSDLVADQFEDYSERGVVDKTDMAHAAAAQRMHATAFSASVTASGGYGPITATASTAYSAMGSETSSRSASLSQSQTTTQKASARARKEHRTSFRLAKKTHVEDQTVRHVKNPDPLHPVRYDFHQLLRKWRVDLHRYGVRVTYDLTVPQPAAELLRVYQELREIDDELEKGFSFAVSPGSVTRASWRSLAGAHGAQVEPPPPLVMSVQSTKLVGAFPPEDPNWDHVDELRVSLPEGYLYRDHETEHVEARTADDETLFAYVSVATLHEVKELTAEMVFGVKVWDASAAVVSVRVWLELSAEAEAKWAAAAYQTLYDAAHKAYAERRHMLDARRTRVAAELSQMNALTLRKLEREELMKAVLRWLFGHKVDFAPPVSGPLYGPDGRIADDGLRGPMLAHGMLVSFLHQAIEWENITYFLYPYFWTHRPTWDLRLRLRHSDPIHEAFLRAGAARVILPVRPGWETAFLTFLQTGNIHATLPASHPYMTIAQEIENFAKTNYPGLVPANPEEVDPDAATKRAEGVLIGSWFEYTPTSALDIKVGDTAPSEGLFNAAKFEPDGFWARVTPLLQAVTGLVDAAAKKLGG